ncbi:uncharacterized protein PAC_08442 [Phialocephala subalpina]|uniref:Uncharacterized protein n=1 Tax=Phialocephala subalpina TaxID=576137 RepID=A0A1L7X0L0_9HELO|nr:uncharacterized protein PAC_08442 [Phialocephala subalpina]
MASQPAGFDFDIFIERYHANTKIRTNKFDPIPVPDAVPRSTRRDVERIVESIDIESTKALLLRAVVKHERHIGKLVTLNCESFSNTNGELWSRRDPLHKTRGDIMAAIDTLDINLVQRLLVDAILSYRDVATRVSAAEKRQSRELRQALQDIASYHERCYLLIRELEQGWNDIGPLLRGRYLRPPPSDSHIAAELGSLLVRLIIADLMLQISLWMPKMERKQYIYEGFYNGLVKLCPLLPKDSTDDLVRQFPVDSSAVDRIRAIELAKNIRRLGSSHPRPNPLPARRPRGPAASYLSRKSKYSKGGYGGHRRANDVLVKAEV